MRRIHSAFAITALIAAFLPQAAMAQTLETIGRDRIESTALTLYSDGQSLVREWRDPVTGDAVWLRLVDLPSATHEDSIRLYRGETPISALSLRRGTLTPQALLDASIGRTITWIATNPQTGEEREIEARLLSHRNGVLIDTGSRVEVAPPGRLALDALPVDLVDGIAIEAQSTAPDPTMPVQLRYIAGGLAWRADYTGAWDEMAGTLRLTGQYAVSNTTRYDYPNARLRLVAGQINRTAPTPIARGQQGPAVAELSALRADAPAPAPPEEATLGDLHIYDVDGQFDVPAGRSIHRPLFEDVEIDAKERYTIEGSGTVHPHQVRLDTHDRIFRPTRELVFETGRDHGLDRVLPAGPIRVFAAEEAEKGAGLVIGEALIPHTAKGGSVELSLGPAMDIEVRRTLVDYRETGTAAQRGQQAPYRATHRIAIRNAGEEPITLNLRERFDGEWKILESDLDFLRSDAGHARWEILVPAGEPIALTYEVQVKP